MSFQQFTFTEAPLPFVFSYLSIVIPILGAAVSILLFARSHRWPWLLLCLGFVLPWFRLVLALVGGATFEPSLMPRKMIFSEGAVQYPPIDWTGFFLVIALLAFFFIGERKQQNNVVEGTAK